MICRKLVALSVFVGVGVVAAAPVATAQATQPTVKREVARPASSTEGNAVYNQYCAPCHGVDGKGKGPAAPAMKVPPTDLTTYAKRHGGQFSEMDLTEVIENERAMPAHGSKDMPIWGEVFRATEQDLDMRKLRMHNLLAYVKSLQVK
jgi:mono/diheme cytochrome c family protein